MKTPLLVGVSAIAGALVAAGICLFVLDRDRSEADEAGLSPEWKEQANRSTMVGRRSYTLPLNNPDMVPAGQASFMQDDDVILGVMVRGEARAYPWWVASNYHVINDTVEDVPLLITLCEVCGGASAFRPEVPDLPGLTLSFQICGISLGTIEIMDHQTFSKWRPFLGTAFEGPLAGRSLERFPLLIMKWSEWKARYPNSSVVNGSPQLRHRPHGAEPGSRIGDPELPTPFAATANLTDHRLDTHELVLGIQRPDLAKSFAIPVNRLTPYPNVFIVALGDQRMLVARDGELAITAFELNSTGAALGEVSVVSTNPLSFRTAEGTTWNAFGLSTGADGPEKRLPSTRSYVTEWYEWVSHSPQSEIVEPGAIQPVR